MAEEKITNVKYELINSSLPKYKEVSVTYSYGNNVGREFCFYPQNLSDKECLKLAAKEINEKIENGELAKHAKKWNNQISGKNKRRFRYGLITALAVAAITLTTIFTYRTFNNGDVTLTLNAGVGSFGGNLIRKKIDVKKGTNLNDVFEISTSTPTLKFKGYEFPCYFWIKNDDSASIPMNYVINDSVELTAKYFDNLNALKGTYLAFITDMFMRAYPQEAEQKAEFLNFYNAVKGKMLSSNNESQVVGYALAFFDIIQPLAFFSVDIPTAQKYFDTFCDHISLFQDQRAQVIGEIASYFMQVQLAASMFTPEIATLYSDLITNSLGKIIVDFAYLYRNVNTNLLQAYRMKNRDDPVLEILLDSIQYFSSSFEKTDDYNKMHLASEIINSFYAKVIAPGINEEEANAMYQNTKTLVEEIL